MKDFGQLKSIFWILVGNTMYALAITIFILPNGLITGGTTGLALFFYHQFGVLLQGFVTVFNVVMFVLGAAVLGKKFALTTVISTFYYPFILSVFQSLTALGKVTEDNLLAVIFSGLLIGGNRGGDPGRSFHRRHGYPAAGAEQEDGSAGVHDHEWDGYGDPSFADRVYGQGDGALRDPSGVGVHVCAEQGAAFRTGQNAGEDRDRAL